MKLKCLDSGAVPKLGQEPFINLKTHSMTKTLIITLKAITYAGSSIGDDIRVEVDVLNNSTAVEMTLKKGATIGLDREIGQLTTDKKSLTVPITIRVTEKDLLFNDVGKIITILNVDLSTDDPQRIVYEVLVAEVRGYTTKKTARFEVTIEARVFNGLIRYVEEEKGGWLRILPENKKKDIAIPKYLKLLLHSVDSKREYFTILEGVLRGSRASVELRNGASHLSSKNSHTVAVQMTYSISKKVLMFQGKEYSAVDYKNVKWKKGFYDIEIPDHPHPGGLNYPESQYATVWFRIGHTGDRYLHTGTRSAGCITLVEQKKWDQLYEVIVRARKGDSLSIGVLEVID